MTRRPWPFPTAASHPKPEPPASAAPAVEVQEVSEPALDHAVEESFPASDPVSVVATKVVADEERSATDAKEARDAPALAAAQEQREPRG